MSFRLRWQKQALPWFCDPAAGWAETVFVPPGMDRVAVGHGRGCVLFGFADGRETPLREPPWDVPTPNEGSFGRSPDGMWELLYTTELRPDPRDGDPLGLYFNKTEQVIILTKNGKEVWRRDLEYAADKATFSPDGTEIALWGGTNSTMLALLSGARGDGIGQIRSYGILLPDRFATMLVGGRALRIIDLSRCEITWLTQDFATPLAASSDGALGLSTRHRLWRDEKEEPVPSHVIVWDLRSGTRLARVDLPGAAEIKGACFLPGSRAFVAATNHGDVACFEPDE